MNNPGQYLVHMTSRGPKVFNRRDGGVGQFKCMVTQPLKDINKFGLLHYSVPKALDALQINNNQFRLRFEFGSGTTLEVPVVISTLDYYNARVSQPMDVYKPDPDPLKVRKNVVDFDEVLQTSINWSIMNYVSGFADPLPNQMAALARISCAVHFDRPSGTYKLTFGYRGHNTLKASKVEYVDGIAGGTGAPGNTPQTTSPDGQNIAFSSGAYAFIDIDGDKRTLAAIGTYDDFHLVAVQMLQIPLRLQMMMGAVAANILSSQQEPNSTIVTRGRIRLCNYVTTGGAAGMIAMHMSIPPTLAPPALLYLQLQVPGTKSKILGQEDERGGWAIPTPPNSYMSQYENFPKNAEYDVNQVRQMPIIIQAPNDNGRKTNFDQYYASSNGQITNGFNFDCIPHGAYDASQNIQGVNQLDNFDCLGTRQNVGAAPSRMIIYGNHSRKSAKDTIKDPRAAAYKIPDNDSRFFQGDSGFGAGLFRQAQVFTSSMITPNWIYTSTADSTIQTFDIQLLWGDTSEQVDASVGNPVQFSIIASP